MSTKKELVPTAAIPFATGVLMAVIGFGIQNAGGLFGGESGAAEFLESYGNKVMAVGGIGSVVYLLGLTLWAQVTSGFRKNHE